MNPYILAMIEEIALSKGMKPWEFINLAAWESLGKPSHEKLMEFAANLDVDDMEPRWKKRLKITAAYEVELGRHIKSNDNDNSGNGPSPEVPDKT
jgi:hypothetical protein